MVLIPIIGANLKDMFGEGMTEGASIGPIPLIVGFVAAFISGTLACKWMISLVTKGKLIYFSIYCLIIGVIAIIAA